MRPNQDDSDEERWLIDYALSHLTGEEVLDLITGNDHRSGGREGREALEFFVFDGIHFAITENSISHGHGPSRYGNAVANLLDDKPEWVIDQALASEKERWTGGFWDDETAEYVLEVLDLRAHYLDEDVQDEVDEIFEEFDVGYDRDVIGN